MHYNFTGRWTGPSPFSGRHASLSCASLEVLDGWVWSPTYLLSVSHILGIGSGGPLRMMGQVARATFGTLDARFGTRRDGDCVIDTGEHLVFGTPFGKCTAGPPRSV